MMNCGYDPAPGGQYDLPPIAPQMWHAYHVAGEQLAGAIIAALLYRWRTGQGQRVSCAVHEAVAKSTEVDLMTWVMRRSLVQRQTCRHAREGVTPHPSIVHTKDGRWVMANLGTRPGEVATARGPAGALRHRGRPRPRSRARRRRAGGSSRARDPTKGTRDHAMEAVQRFVRAFTYENVPWREAQEAGMLWAPLRKPHENALDPHWLARHELHRRRAPRARPVVPLRDEQVAGDGDHVDRRPARAAPERGRRRPCSGRASATCP